MTGGSDAHPTHALAAEAGLSADGKLIAPLSSGSVLRTKVPEVKGDRVRLEMGCADWIPQKVVPGSQDPRTLGVQVSRSAPYEFL